MNKAKETDEKEVEMEKGVELKPRGTHTVGDKTGHGSDYSNSVWVAKSFLLFCTVCFGRYPRLGKTGGKSRQRCGARLQSWVLAAHGGNVATDQDHQGEFNETTHFLLTFSSTGLLVVEIFTPRKWFGDAKTQYFVFHSITSDDLHHY